jgi:L-fuculose-phosphate aldolase
MNPAQMVAYTGRMLFERRLTDMAGGNVSLREGDMIFISPAHSGSRMQWQLNESDIVKGNVNDDAFLQNPSFSREGKAHVAIYRNFPDVKGVIHAHAFHVLPFCSAGKPIPPVLEDTQKFGVIECVKEAHAHSQELADNVITGLQGKEERIRIQAAAVLLPQHGIIVAGKTLFDALDAVERIDWNAYCILVRSALGA